MSQFEYRCFILVFGVLWTEKCPMEEMNKVYMPLIHRQYISMIQSVFVLVFLLIKKYTEKPTKSKFKPVMPRTASQINAS